MIAVSPCASEKIGSENRRLGGTQKNPGRPRPLIYIQVNFHPREGITLTREGNSVRMVVCNAQHKRIGEILGLGGLELHREAEAELRKGITAIAPMVTMVTIHSDVGTASTDDAETEADASPVV